MAYKVVGYDPQRQVLRLQFDGGEVYEYEGVPQDVAEGTEYAALVHLPRWLRERVIGKYRMKRIKGIRGG